MRRTILLSLGAIAALVLIVVLIIMPWKGTLTLTSAVLPDQLTIDSAPLQPVQRLTRKLSKGKHTITASKKGYQKRSETVIIQSGVTTHYELTLVANVPVQATENAAANSSSVVQAFGGGLQVASSNFVEGDQWVVAKVKPRQANTDYLYTVMKRSGNAYSTVLGPGSYFLPPQLAKLPQSVRSALQAEGYRL